MKKNGFTLLELIISVAIVFLLCSVVASSLQDAREERNKINLNKGYK